MTVRLPPEVQDTALEVSLADTPNQIDAPMPRAGEFGAQAAVCVQDAWGETYQRLINEGLPQGTVLHALSGPVW